MESRHLVVMMTDIQGFTRATSGMGRDEVEALLARHEDLLVPVIKEYEGTIVKGLGDAFLVTFESPTKAVQAGSRIQEVLREHNAKGAPAEDLKVRVALNAGEVNLRENDVFGEAVNITARVEGVCAAEQVTLTEAVYLLLDRERVETEYLEEVELKGIPFPVKLYRVVPYWLGPDERGIERARSKPAAAATEGAGARPGRLAPLAAALVVALGLGAWWARPAAPATVVRRLTAERQWEPAFEALAEGQRQAPSPELTAAAVDLLGAQLAARRQAGQWAEAYRDLERFTRILPGIEGVSRPSELRQLGLEGVRALRAARDFEGADALLDALLAVGGLEEQRPELARWAGEDLQRAWDAAFPKDQPAPEDMERRVGSEALSLRLRRLETLDRGSPWVAYVHGVRAMLAGAHAAVSRRRSSGDDVARAMKDLAAATAREAALGGRRELEPVVRAFLRYFPPPSERDDAWTWAEQWLVHRVGAWIEAPLTRWANEPCPVTASDSDLISNQNLRRNALRILTRRGVTVAPVPEVHLRGDLALLARKPKDLGENVLLEEIQDVSLRFSALPAPTRAVLEAEFRAVVQGALEADDEGLEWRATHLALACDQGWKDLCLPQRELFRDLLYFLRYRLQDWRFKTDEWYQSALRARLGRLEGIVDPWRAQIRDLLKEARPGIEKADPTLLPELDAALAKLE